MQVILLNVLFEIEFDARDILDVLPTPNMQ